METKLPEFMQSCLWSYDISTMDPQKSKVTVITQAINHGDSRQLQWMLQNYSDREIREVVTHPTRGMWWREKLRFWLNKYGVMIDPLRFELAIREIELRPMSLYKEFWERVDREKNEVARRYS